MLREAQETILPPFQSRIQKALGTDVQIEVDWDSFTKGEKATIAVWMLRENDGRMILYPLLRAFESLVSDNFVKDTLSKSIKKVKVSNVPNLRELQVKHKTPLLEIAASFEVGEDSKLNSEELQKKILALEF